MSFTVISDSVTAEWGAAIIRTPRLPVVGGPGGVDVGVGAGAVAVGVGAGPVGVGAGEVEVGVGAGAVAVAVGPGAVDVGVASPSQAASKSAPTATASHARLNRRDGVKRLWRILPLCTCPLHDKRNDLNQYRWR